MPKRLYGALIVALLAFPCMAQGQRLSNYSLTVDTVTFNTIVSTGTAMSFTSLDDGYAVVTLPFAIGYGETSFPSGTPIACSANGFLQLGVSSTSGLTASHINENNRYINAILREDGHLNHNTGAGAYYEYDAEAGTFIVEYHLLGRYAEPYGAYSYQIVFHDNSTIEIIYDSVDLGGANSCLWATFLTDGPHGDRAYITDTWANPVFSSNLFAFRPISNLPAHGLRYTLTPPPAACPRPISITVTGTDYNGFDISWADTSDATSWLVRLMATGTDSVISYNTETSYPVSFTGLAANTDYRVSVAGLCLNGDTSAFRTMMVHTACEYITVLPYTMGFEVADGVTVGSITSNAFVECWHRLNEGQYVGIPYVDGSEAAHTGSRGLNWTTFYDDYSAVVLPRVDTTVRPVRDLYLSFWARASHADYYNPRVQVGVMADPDDIATFQRVATVDIGGSAVWEEYTVPLSGSRGSGSYVALLSANSSLSSHWEAYFDDFTLQEAPDCREAVRLTASDVTASTANIHWTEIGNSPTWLVELDSAGTTIRTQVVYDTLVGLTGLTAHTQYTVRVAARCGHDTSVWSSIELRTPCEVVDSLPYFYDFEDAPIGDDSVANTALYCWTRLNNAVLYDNEPHIANGSYYNHTPGGSKGLYWYGTRNDEWGHGYGDYQCIVLPEVDSSLYPINTLRLKFWASSSYSPVFQVGVITHSDDINTFQPVDTVYVDNSTSHWREYIVPLASYNGVHGRVAVKAERPTTVFHARLDDFTLEPIPTCLPPTNMRATPATTAGDVVVSWTELGSATSWQMAVVGSGHNPDTCTTSTIVHDDEVLLHLDDDTVYDIYVRSICSMGDTSEWGLPLRLMSGYNINIDTLGSATLFTCRSLICDPGGPDGTYGNSNHAILYVYPGSADSVITFWGSVHTDALDYLEIYEGIGTDGTLLWNPPVYNMTTQDTIPHLISRAGPITLLWHTDESVVRDGFALNVRCLQLTDCPRPIDFTLVSSYTDTVRVAWHDTAYTGGYELCYGPVGMDPYTETDSIVAVYDTAYAFTNLLRDTAYDIYLRTNCGSQQSWWVGPLTVIPGTFFMGPDGSADITACSFVVYDDGGPMNPSSEEADYRLTIHAVDPDSIIFIHGSTSTLGSRYGHLSIFDGSDTMGTLLWQNSIQPTWASDVQETIPNILSSANAVTLLWRTSYYRGNDGFELHVDCISPPSCSYVNNTRVSHVTNTSVLADWDVNTFPSDIQPAYYEIELLEDGRVIATDTTSTHPYWVSGLTPSHNYCLQVHSVCGDGDRAPWDTVSFVTPCMGGNSAEISGGTITTNTFPTYTQAGYSYTQTLYPSTLVGSGGAISAIAYHTADSCPPRNICLYMGEVERNAFPSYLDHIPLSQLHLVYMGTFGGSANSWVYIHLDSIFLYCGMGNIVVAIDDNTGYSSTPATFYTSNNGQSIHWHSNSDINPANPGLAAGTSTQQNDIRFMMACDSTLTCLPPNPVMQSITAHEATLNWAPGLNETAWHIAHRAEDDTVWITDTVGWSATTYTVAGLNANTNYVFRVAADCSTPLASFVWGHTDCDPQAIPFNVDFEDWTPGHTIPYCWYKGSVFPTVVVSNYYAHSGSNVLYMYSSRATYSYIVLPLTAAPVDSLQLSFWMRKPNSYHPHDIVVGMMTDPTDISTFQPLDTVSCTHEAVWETFEIALNNHTGTGGRIALLSPDGSDPYIDDIEVSFISPCARPYEVYADNITPTTATIHWSDTSTNNYEIEYGPTGFTHGTGTLLTTAGNSVVLTGLSISMQYDVYVRGICTPDTGSWSYCHTFRPSCYPLDNLPWFDDIESHAIGSPSTGSDFIPCWNRLNNGNPYGGYPYVAANNHTPGGYKSLYWCNNTTLGTYGDYQCIVLPGIDTTVYPINTVQLRFWVAPQNANYTPTFQMGIMGDPYDIATFQCVDSVTINGSGWTEVECPFNSFNGLGCHPAIKAERPTSAWWANLDDFRLELAPSCPQPHRIRCTGNTVSTITLDWNERGSATQWQIAVETAPLTPPTHDTLVSTHPATIPSLVAGVNYYLYVRSICCAGDTSAWSDAFVCTPGSWNMRANQVDTLRMCGGIIYDDGGATGNYSPNQTSLIILYPDAPNSLVCLNGTASTLSIGDCSLRIYDGVGTGGTVLWRETFVRSTFGPITSTSGPLTIYFCSDATHIASGFAINVSCISATCRVSNVRLDSTVLESDSQLAVTWDTNGADYYEVAWGMPGFVPTTGMITTYANHATITGLTSLTYYDVCVRSICGGDTGSWTRATFQTAVCDYVAVRYSYDSTMSATTEEFAPIGTSFYNYTYVQTLVDSAQMAGLTDPIGAFGFNPASTERGLYFNHVDVYMANVPESDLSSGFIHPDSNHVFIPVITDADMRYNSTGWLMHRFDTPFIWDGHSNVLFAVNRRQGSHGSDYTSNFNAHNTSNVRTRYSSQNNIAYDPYTISGGYTSPVIGDLKFVTCGPASCQAPIITGTSHSYEDATVTWLGDGTDYEVNIKESISPSWPASDIAVTGNTYTFTGLQPSTHYTLRVRQNCTADSLGHSEWSTIGLTTDDILCTAPYDLTVSNITSTTATFDWVASGDETMWELHVWYSGGFDSFYTVATHPVTLSGFTAGITYRATVRPLCGTAHNIAGNWSGTTRFTTAICPNVTGLNTSNVTTSSVRLNWNADTMARSWIVEYGYHGFDQGTGNTVVTATNSYTVNGLLDGVQYDFHVRAVCGTDWVSEGWTSTTATTQQGGFPCEAPSAVSAAVAGNAATVSWATGLFNISFELEYGPRGFGHSGGTVVTATSSPCTLSNLDYETDYDVYVRAYCGQNTYSAWSTVASFTTEPQGSDDCDSVADLAASNVTESSALLTWTPGTVGEEWEVVLTTPSGTILSEASTTEHQYALSSLTPSTAYVAKVRTVCGDGIYSSFVSTSFTTDAVGIDGVVELGCTIYPNPATSATTISVSGVSGMVQIAVVDMEGREVASETLECSGGCVKTFDVDNLAQGAYFVRITSENVSMVRKLIVR